MPSACRCGRTLEPDLCALFESVLCVDAPAPALVFRSPDDARRLELRLPGPDPSAPLVPASDAGETALIEIDPGHAGPYARDGALRGRRAWSSWPLPCPHGLPVPLISLGRRAIPAWCARARFEGEVGLLGEGAWPGAEACAQCPWYRGSMLGAVRCAAPEVEQGSAGLALEVDIYRQGRKRRVFIDPRADVPAAVREAMHRRERLRPDAADPLVDAIDLNPYAANAPPGARARLVDIKFVVGEARQLEAESDAFMERWRYYWNGQDWMRKPAGASLHDWNKWGQELEFVSACEQGGLPPPSGWPPVLDLPGGAYLLRVLSVHWTTGRRGERELEWTLKVLDGDHRGRRVFRRSAVRTPTTLRLAIQDLAMVVGRLARDMPRPDEPGFDTFFPAARGVALHARVSRKGAFRNLDFVSRAAGRGPRGRGRE